MLSCNITSLKQKKTTKRPFQCSFNSALALSLYTSVPHCLTSYFVSLLLPSASSLQNSELCLVVGKSSGKQQSHFNWSWNDIITSSHRLFVPLRLQTGASKELKVMFLRTGYCLGEPGITVCYMKKVTYHHYHYWQIFAEHAMCLEQCWMLYVLEGFKQKWPGISFLVGTPLWNPIFNALMSFGGLPS